jgi:hypothetical protein
VLFNIEDDFGDCLVGYIVPDSFSAVPSIRISADGRTLLTMPANETRDALVAARRHETGRCGFRIDAATLPGLAGFSQLEIHSEDTGLLIYRRPVPDGIQRRMFRLETHIFPLWRLDDAVKPYFQYHLRGADALGHETVTQLFLLNKIGSSYISGRILYRNYAYFIENGKHDVIVTLQDPYEEMAERILVLNKVRQIGGRYFSERDAMRFEAAIAFCELLPLQDDKQLIRALTRMSPEVAIAFSNPVVRQLTTSTPDEMPTGSAVATALDLLASFALIGRRSDANDFCQRLAEMTGLDEMTLPPLPQFGSVAQLATLLRDSRIVDTLLEKDLELFYYVNQALEASADLPRAGAGALSRRNGIDDAGHQD